MSNLVPVGALRFNTETSKLEYFNGTRYVNITTDSPEQRTGGTRGLFGGGFTSPSVTNEIDFINVDSTGNAIDFGDLQQARRGIAGTASRIRGIFAGGRVPGDVNSIEFVTIASQGGGADFGDLTITSHYGTGLSNGTRGIILAMENSNWGSNNSNRIDFIAIASTGNAQDFGDLYTGTRETDGCESKTRGIVFGGTPSSINVIQFITMSTQGDSADFGDTTSNSQRGSAGSNAVRGLLTLGTTPTTVNTVNFITIATLGNALDFGDLTQVRGNATGTSSPTRFVEAGGATPSLVDTIDYAQIMTKGDFNDFGELVGTDRSQLAGLSNGHGGLG